MLTRLVPPGVLLAGLAVLGLWLWHDWRTDRLEAQLTRSQEQIARLSRERDNWQAAAEQRYMALQAMIEQYRHAAQAVTALDARLTDMDAPYQALREQTKAAPETDDGPVAPVLRRMIEGLP